MPPIPRLVQQKYKIHQGDCLDVLRTMPDASVDAVVTDPPYGLAFMGKNWDHGVLGEAFWSAAILALKPGGYACIFGGTRTYHRLACAVEDAGFEVRDCLMWIYGSGFPKGKGCLKPAWEPILLCRRPGPKVLPLGIDECRVQVEGPTRRPPLSTNKHEGYRRPWNADPKARAACESRRLEAHDKRDVLGRYPANLVHDGSEEVLEAFAAFGPTSTTGKRTERSRNADVAGTAWGTSNHKSTEYANEPPGTAARFFYCAKASKSERGEGNHHPTVKPLALIRWLVRLVCPPGGTVLDPFTGSGTTGVACLRENRNAILVEREPAYVEIIKRRMADEESKGVAAPGEKAAR